MLAVDVALATVHSGELRVLLMRRPELERWALPGGFVRRGEGLDEAARRILADKAGLRGDLFLEQLYTFGRPDRDPRTHVVSVTYYALVDQALLNEASSEAFRDSMRIDVEWEGEQGGPAHAVDREGNPLRLAFDHARILGTLVQRLRGKLDYAALGFQLLPRQFTLRELQTVHEVILGRSLNKDSFRRRLLASGLIEATGKREQDVLHRPAELYRIARPSAV